MRKDVAARALEFTILTAARTGEVVGARWSEIDLESNTWIIPAARMKSHREHRVPLSPRAVELLSGLYREGGNSHVFIGARTGAALGNMAMPDVLQQMEQSDVTVRTATVKQLIDALVVRATGKADSAIAQMCARSRIG